MLSACFNKHPFHLFQVFVLPLSFGVQPVGSFWEGPTLPKPWFLVTYLLFCMEHIEEGYHSSSGTLVETQEAEIGNNHQLPCTPAMLPSWGTALYPYLAQSDPESTTFSTLEVRKHRRQVQETRQLSFLQLEELERQIIPLFLSQDMEYWGPVECLGAAKKFIGLFLCEIIFTLHFLSSTLTSYPHLSFSHHYHPSS